MRLFFFFFGVFFVVSGWGYISFPVLADSQDTDVVIKECQKRTGLSESGCVVLIKKYMTVERCQDYTKLSAKECEQKILEIKNDPKFQDKTPTPTSSSSPTPSVSGIPSSSVVPTSQPVAHTLRGRILEAKKEKEQRFNLIQDETKSLIDFLKQNGQDTGVLETALREFNEKQQATLLAYDRYQSLAESLKSNDPFALNGPRDTVLQVLSDTTEYYRLILLPALQKSVTEARNSLQ